MIREFILNNALLSILLVMLTGGLLGRITVRGISLGTSGVLLAGLFFGHFGVRVSKEVMDIGLLFFVYAVGIQAGPRFLRTFKSKRIRYLFLGITTVIVGMILTITVARVMNLPYDLATGMFTGSLTNTPALAAAVDKLDHIAPGHSANLSVGYGIAYPFSIIGVTLLIQLLPKIRKRDLSKEEEDWLEAQHAKSNPHEVKHFEVQYENCFDKTITELNLHSISLVNISRIKRGRKIFPARGDFKIKENDIVTVVGHKEDFEKIHDFFGREVEMPLTNKNVISSDIEINSSLLDEKRIEEIHPRESYGVIITRVRRQGLELTPVGSTTLERGDVIRVVGEKEMVNNFAKIAGAHDHKSEETSILIYLIGLLIGVAVGSITIPLFINGLTIKLGAAGGVFIVSLILAHYGRIGKYKLHVPQAANFFSREIGLMLFLAGAGTNAGAKFVGVVQQYGLNLLVAGAFITSISVLVTLFLMIVVFKMGTLSTMGSLASCMTNPSALAAAKAHGKTDLVTLRYASIFPVALISKIIGIQILLQILMAWK
jgi:putative transport protein